VHYPKQQQSDDTDVGFRELRHPSIFYIPSRKARGQNQKKKNKPQGGVA